MSCGRLRLSLRCIPFLNSEPILLVFPRSHEEMMEENVLGREIPECAVAFSTQLPWLQYVSTKLVRDDGPVVFRKGFPHLPQRLSFDLGHEDLPDFTFLVVAGSRFLVRFVDMRDRDGGTACHEAHCFSFDHVHALTRFQNLISVRKVENTGHFEDGVFGNPCRLVY